MLEEEKEEKGDDCFHVLECFEQIVSKDEVWIIYLLLLSIEVKVSAMWIAEMLVLAVKLVQKWLKNI